MSTLPNVPSVTTAYNQRTSMRHQLTQLDPILVYTFPSIHVYTLVWPHLALYTRERLCTAPSVPCTHGRLCIYA